MKINIHLKWFFYPITLCGAFLFILSCSTLQDSEIEDITQTILTDTSNFFYLDSRNSLENEPSLPIGIFDSGTGGLAVLEVILNLDKFDNRTHQFISTGDGLPDFREEYFLFLADQANMPYGNYSRENNIVLLKEHIVKDAQFLLGRKYYQSAQSKAAETDKEPVKCGFIWSSEPPLQRLSSLWPSACFTA